MAQVDAQLRAGGGHPFAVEIVAVGGQQPDIGAQQRQIVGNVAPDAPQTDADGAGIGVGGHQGSEGASADVHIDAPGHHGIAAAAKHIAPPGNAALFGQVGDVDRHAGAGDAQLCGDILLGNQRIGFNQLQYLPFPLGHCLHS